MQTGKALLTKYLLTTQSATPFGNTQSAHSREAHYSWSRSRVLALAGSWNTTTLSSDSWDMMSPTLDGGFFVCRQGRSERGGDQEAEVVKFERLLRQTGSGNQKLISLQIFLRVCMTPPPLAQGLLTYGTAISWAHHVYFQNNLLAPPLLCNSKTDMSLVGQL